MSANAITNNGSLVFNQKNSSLAMSIAVNGSGTITHNANGSTTLSGTNTYSGGTEITAGNLIGTVNSFGTGTITDNATLTFSQSTNGSFSKVISGSGKLVKEGSGNVILSGINTYSGGTTISGGTLTGNVNTFGTGNIIDNAALVFVQNSAATYGKDISGTGTLTKDGSGNLTLNGSNSYAGGTTINAGILTTGTTSLGSGNVTNNAALVFDQTSNGTFAGTISGSGTLTKNGTGNVTLSGSNSYFGGTSINAGTLTGTTAAFGTGAIVNNNALVFDQTATGSFNGNITGGGSLGKTGTGNVTLSGNNTYSGGTTISGGTLTGSTTSFGSGNIVNNANLVFDQNSNATYGNLISGAGHLSKTGSGNLTLTASNTYSGSTTISGGTLTGTTLSFSTGSISNNAALVLDQNTDGNFSNFMSGIGSLTKSGSGNITLIGHNTYTGGTTISAGTLTGSLMSFGGGNIVNNGALVVDEQANAGYSGIISGTGSLTKQGNGSVALVSSNYYSGGTIISAGQLSGNSNSFGSGGISIGSSGHLVITQAFDGSLNNALTGTGAMSKAGTGKVSLAASNNYSGGTTIHNGSLVGTTASFGSGTIINYATLIFDQTNNAGFSSSITGSGQLIKQGSSAITLSANNIYAGGTTISAGSLIGTTASFGSGSIVNNAAMVFDQNGAGLFANAISGSGSLTKQGTGNVTLTGSNLYSGGTTISAGSLTGSTSTFGTGAIINNAGLILDQGTSGMLAGAISGTGSVTKKGAGTATLAGDNSGFTGLTKVEGGTLIIANRSGGSASVTGGTLQFGQLGSGGVSNLSGDLTVSNVGSTLSLQGSAVLNQAGSINLADNTVLSIASGSASASLTADSMMIGNNVTFNLSGISTASDADRVLISTDNGISGDFASISIGGFAGTVDYLTVNTRKSADGLDYLASYDLSWTAHNNLAHGTFTLTNAPDSFVLDVALADQAANAAQGWNGKSLTKDGLGKLILAADNSYSGTTTISAGSLQLGNGGTTGSVAGNIVNNASLLIRRSDTFTLANAISGSGSLVQTGTGTTILTGANSYTGGTELRAGTLQIASDAALGAPGGGISFNGGGLATTASFDTARTISLIQTGAFHVAANTELGLTGEISGYAHLLKQGEGTLRLDNASNDYGATVVEQGRLIGNAASINGLIANAGTVEFAQNSNAQYAGDITGYNTLDGQMVKSGSGALTLTGTSTLDWTIAGGSLISSAERFGGDATIASGASLVLDQFSNAIHAATLSGTGNFVKQGNATLVLTADSSFTGTTTIAAGALTLGMNGTSGSLKGDIVNDGELITARSDTLTLSQTISGSGSLIQAGSGTLILAGHNLYAGGTEMLAGTVQVAADDALGAASGFVNFQGGTLASTANFATARAFTFSETGSIDVASATELSLNGVVSGPGNLLKQGEGTLRLSNAANSYQNSIVAAGGLTGTAASLRGTIANAGTVTFDQASDGIFAGTIAGFDGTNGQMVKQGAGNLTLTGTSSLDWTITSGQLSTSIERFAGNVQIGSAGTLALSVASDTSLTSRLSGSGQFSKLGSGELTIDGDNSGFTGTSTIKGGALIVGSDDRHGTARLGGSVTLGEGVTLGGHGTIGSGSGSLVSIGSGALLAPGNSIGTLTINGDLSFAAGAIYQVEVDPAGTASDLTHVTGRAALSGASVLHIGEDGVYNPLSTYRILSADGGVTGKFADVASNFAFLTPTLIYDQSGNNVDLQLKRNETSFADMAMTRNEKATAGGLDSMAVGGSSLYNAMASLPDDASQIRAALNALSGEAHATASNALAASSQATSAAVLGRLAQAFGDSPAAPVAVLAYGPAETAKTPPAGAIDLVAPAAIPAAVHLPYAAWGSVFGSWTSQKSDGNAARSRSDTGGFTTGIDAAIYDNWRFGLLAGYSRSSFRVDGRASSGSSDNYTLGSYAGAEWALPQGALALRSGLAYRWHRLDVSRTVDFAGFADTITADYNAGTVQAFAELAYKAKLGESSLIEPYANLAYMHLRTDGFSESSQNGSGLNVHANSQDTTYSTLGLRASTQLDLGGVATTARGDLGWRHAYGDVVPTMIANFAGSSAFVIAGAPIDRDAALVEAGLDFALARNTTLGISYQGQFSSSVTQNGVRAVLGVKF